MRDYIALTKPRITWLILMSTGIGYFFGLPNASGWREFLSHIHLLSLLHTIIGTALIASGTAALNQWFERDADRKMRRTAGRPLPLGLLTPGRALAFGIALSVAGFVELWLGVNLLCRIDRRLHAGHVSLPLYAPEAAHMVVHHGGRDSRRHAADDRLCRGGGQS